MRKIKIENLIKSAWSGEDIEIPDGIDDLISALSHIRDAYEKKVTTKNRRVKKDIRDLKKEKQKFIKDSYFGADLKRLFSLTDQDLKNIPTQDNFGVRRYLREDIFNYLTKTR